MKHTMQKSRFLFLALLSNACLMNAEKLVISSYDEFQKLKDSKKNAVVKVSAKWCGACKMIQGAFDDIANDPTLDHVVFAYVDADDNGDIVHRENISGLPTFLILSDGEVTETIKGVSNPDTFAEELKTKLASAKPIQGSVQAAVDTKSEVKTEETTVNPVTGTETTTKDVVKADESGVKQETTTTTQPVSTEGMSFVDKVLAFLGSIFAAIKGLFEDVFNWITGLFGK